MVNLAVNEGKLCQNLQVFYFFFGHFKTDYARICGRKLPPEIPSDYSHNQYGKMTWVKTFWGYYQRSAVLALIGEILKSLEIEDLKHLAVDTNKVILSQFAESPRQSLTDRTQIGGKLTF